MPTARFTTPLVTDGLREAADFIADTARDRLVQEVDMLSHNSSFIFDSPLEELFFIWWLAYRTVNEDHLATFGGLLIDLHHDVIVNNERFVVDYAIYPRECERRARFQPLGIELDGHAFHERTTEQVERRDRRDRALGAAGWRILHFSYSEFTRDPGRCVGDIMEMASRAASAAI